MIEGFFNLPLANLHSESTLFQYLWRIGQTLWRVALTLISFLYVISWEGAALNKVYADGSALDVVRSPLTFCDDQYIYSLGMWIVDTNIYEGDGHEGVVMCEWKCVVRVVVWTTQSNLACMKLKSGDRST